MDNNEWDVSSGTICTVRAAGGRFGISISPSCVEYMIAPLGFRMARGEGATRRLRTGKSWKKCAVLPVSAITLVVPLEKSDAGGPNEESKEFSTKLLLGGDACKVLW